jgi:hypothetical protein
MLLQTASNLPGPCVDQRILRACRLTGSLYRLRPTQDHMSLADTLMTDWRGRMTAGTTQEFAAFIGLDWADAQHDVCLQVAGSDKREWTT